MEKMNFDQMESVVGGDDWVWPVHVHIGCAIGGFIAGGGFLGVLAYGACLAVAYN